MSAPENSTTMSGGNNIPNESSRLEQPQDALAMESIPNQLPEGAAPSTEKNDATEPSLSNGADSAPSSSKQPHATDNAVSQIQDTNSAQPPSLPKQEQHDSDMAIGPAQDEIKAITPGAPDAGPICHINLLLTTGSRHPYKIDAKYLKHRNVNIPEETESGQPDPFSISVYTLKELILREWRNDWDTKPSSPSSIRLIHFGKLLDDKEQLKKYQFSTENPNVVHMSIRPQGLDEEDPKSGSKHSGSGGAEGRQRSGGCCVIL